MVFAVVSPLVVLALLRISIRVNSEHFDPQMFSFSLAINLPLSQKKGLDPLYTRRFSKFNCALTGISQNQT
ncbi:hypothetical protein IWQ55_006404 [Labrenzia sp. EL_208]|nr:hypothetical protein [Labrenzia sp. EL_132]MBG6233169.1 hypothetical protein [Labrenzia sp. EL_208]